MNKPPDLQKEIPSAMGYIALEHIIGPYVQIKVDEDGTIYSIRTGDRLKEISRGDTITITRRITTTAICPDNEVVWQPGDKAKVLAIVRPLQGGRGSDIILVERTRDQTIGFLDPQEVQ